MGVAVKITDVPWQTVSCEATIETLTGLLGFTVMVMVFDVAGLLVTQVVSEDNKTQVTRSRFVGT